MSYDPVMAALEETKRLEAQRQRVRAEQETLRLMEEQQRSKPYTVGRLLADLRDPAIADYTIEAEGCDCINKVKGVEIDIAAMEVTVRI